MHGTYAPQIGPVTHLSRKRVECVKSANVVPVPVADQLIVKHCENIDLLSFQAINTSVIASSYDW